MGQETVIRAANGCDVKSKGNTEFWSRSVWRSSASSAAVNSYTEQSRGSAVGVANPATTSFQSLQNVMLPVALACALKTELLISGSGLVY